MIIESNKLAKQTVNFFNEEVEFDKNGCATVIDELGVQIVENFPDLAWEKGKKLDKKTEVKEDDSEEMIRLKAEIDRLGSVNNGLKSEIQQLKDSEQTWRDTCQKYIKFLQEKGLKLEETTPTEPEGNNKGFVVPEGFEDLLKEMSEKNLKELKDWSKEQLALTDEILKDFSGQKGKENLIKYLFENIIK